MIPIFKAADEMDPDDYRPISLLSNLNRISFEKLMSNHLIQFINKDKPLDSAQYGFREGSSTTHAILDIISSIQNNMDHKLFSCAIFIDLKKAFDTVQHSILLRKLEFYGVRGLVNDRFGSYLSNSNQTKEISGYISSKEIILVSVLGPLLFLLFINDITNSSTKLKYFLFADDTNLLCANRNLNLLETTINAELKLL